MNSSENMEQLDLAEQYVISLIREEHPDWVKHDGSCERCEQYYKSLDDLISLYE